MNNLVGSKVCHRLNGITIEQETSSILIVSENENDRSLYTLVHVKESSVHLTWKKHNPCCLIYTNTQSHTLWETDTFCQCLSLCLCSEDRHFKALYWEMFSYSKSLGRHISNIIDGCITCPIASLCPKFFTLNSLSKKTNDLVGSKVCHIKWNHHWTRNMFDFNSIWRWKRQNFVHFSTR